MRFTHNLVNFDFINAPQMYFWQSLYVTSILTLLCVNFMMSNHLWTFLLVQLSDVLTFLILTHFLAFWLKTPQPVTELLFSFPVNFCLWKLRNYVVIVFVCRNLSDVINCNVICVLPVFKLLKCGLHPSIENWRNVTPSNKRLDFKLICFISMHTCKNVRVNKLTILQQLNSGASYTVQSFWLIWQMSKWVHPIMNCRLSVLCCFCVLSSWPW